MEYGLHVKESLNHVQNGVSFHNAIFWTSFYVPVWESPAPPPRPLLGLCPSQGLRDVGKKKGTRSAKLDMLLKMVVLSLLLLLLAVNTASLAKIAGFAAVGGSGYINMRNIMEELASRGHEVH